MINIYKNKNNYQYKTASVIREDRTEYKFRYKKVTQEDISKVQYLSGLRTSVEEFIISTTHSFPFDILQLSVNIGGFRYKILDSYREDNMHGEGMFRKDHLVTTYLRIGK